MRVEAINGIKSDGYVLSAEDVVTVPDEIGAKWCKHGWARDTSGAVPTGERRVLNASLDVDNVVTVQGATEI